MRHLIALRLTDIEADAVFVALRALSSNLEVVDELDEQQQRRSMAVDRVRRKLREAMGTRPSLVRNGA